MPDQTRSEHLTVPTAAERIAGLETLAERRRIRMAAAELDVTEARERIAALEAQLRDEGNRVGRLEDALRAACAEGSDARARLDELETVMFRDVSRMLADLGITNPPPRLAALLRAEADQRMSALTREPEGADRD
ncbi:hypothetical protein NONO_c60080 [Nocardia nova SH22a]|uniref:Uncharacterized protein n=1 Tax=Nocardia nova SH22a TaxID=1415166 RepID=W5TNP2_9NOCA|nr:hypothetical protein [Nocardia nova]AHH20784.1 hypothetical protein NONO_c60080 [Nocardia nova SH22a]